MAVRRSYLFLPVEKVGDNLFMLTAEVFDVNEMMHWVKSFIGRIVRIEGGNEEIISRFYRDISRMHRIYCKEEETV